MFVWSTVTNWKLRNFNIKRTINHCVVHFSSTLNILALQCSSSVDKIFIHCLFTDWIINRNTALVYRLHLLMTWTLKQSHSVLFYWSVDLVCAETHDVLKQCKTDQETSNVCYNVCFECVSADSPLLLTVSTGPCRFVGVDQCVLVAQAAGSLGNCGVRVSCLYLLRCTYFIHFWARHRPPPSPEAAYTAVPAAGGGAQHGDFFTCLSSLLFWWTFARQVYTCLRFRRFCSLRSAVTSTFTGSHSSVLVKGNSVFIYLIHLSIMILHTTYVFKCLSSLEDLL